MRDSNRKSFWSFWRRPLHAKWISRQIDARANAQLVEIQRLEARLHYVLCIAEDRHRDMLRHVEVRALMSVQEAQHQEDPYALPKLIEARAELAAAEAKAYADQSVGSLSKSLAASNRIAVSVMKRLTEAEGALTQLAGITDRIDVIPEMLDARIAPVETFVKEESKAIAALITDATAAKTELAGVTDRINVVPEMLDARITPIETFMKEESKAIAALMAEATAAKTEFAARCEGIEQELGRIVGDYNAQLRNTEHRIEFVRSETMYEMQAANYNATNPSDARIVAPEKVMAMRATGLKLNIGCGHIPLDGYLNVDSRELPGIDVIADATGIPFERNELAEIHSSHLVEHFTSHILERVLLPHWRSLLRPGGVLTTIAPDGAAMLEAVNTQEMTFEDFREVLFGGQDYDGDFHYNLITPRTFTESLARAGFIDIIEEYVGKRNGRCFEFKISAKKA